ncbi:hypothetical protein C8R45DRAFT_1210675 [Mycena sanguinolenta]|nr:hypothetical protein C8R45DRAFT_1210675 [Mycena sanguinolenta]
MSASSSQDNLVNDEATFDLAFGSGRSIRKTSCEECHRLKLKCDKKVPCGPCIRRLCANICPTGTLQSTGRGKRSVRSQVPILTAKISEMGERIRQLERAVADTRTDEDSSDYPLLSTTAQPPSEFTPAQSGEALGSFSVNEEGNAVYFGPTAGTEALFSIEGASDDAHLEQRFSFTAITESFPFSPNKTTWDKDQALEQLFAHLPLEVRAWSLCQIYFRNGCWTGMPVMQSEAVELLTLIYHPNTGTQHQSPATPQQIAVLYLIFALGSLVDLDLPPYNSDADHYFDVASAAMTIKPLFENPTVVTVQALTLISCYYAHASPKDLVYVNIPPSLTLISFIYFGPDRESFGPELSPQSLNRCRALFWETYSIETIYGLSVGRPTGTGSSNINCPCPPDETEDAQPFVKIYPGYRQARWESTKNVTAPIMEAFLTTTKPSYEAVLAIDQKIRKYMHSTPFENFPKYENEPPFAFIQRHLIPHFCKIMLMYIHSGSFIEAIRATSVHPLASSYSASFLAAYRNASEIIKADIMNFSTHPMLFTRWWAIWKSLFNAAVIVGTIAIKHPNANFASNAMVELFTAVDLIEKGAVSSGRARSGLAILRRLRDKAIGVYTQFSGHDLTPPPSDDPQTEEELKIFAGYTRVIANKVLQRGPPRLNTPPQTGLPAQWANASELDVQREFDLSVIRYFDSATSFANVVPLPEPQGLLPFDDAGLFFTSPNSAADVFASDFQHAQNVVQEIQWAQFLQA